jgi:hypothetical protein
LGGVYLADGNQIMRRRLAIAIFLVLLIAGRAFAASDQLVATLKQLGKAVDDMSANISKATSDADAKLLANVTRQALAGGLKEHQATADIQASAGFCRVTIKSSAWELWSEARAGAVTDHGATIH